LAERDVGFLWVQPNLPVHRAHACHALVTIIAASTSTGILISPRCGSRARNRAMTQITSANDHRANPNPVSDTNAVVYKRWPLGKLTGPAMKMTG